MNLPSLIPQPYRLLAQVLAVVLVIVAAVAWWHSHNAGQQRIGYDRANAEWNAWKASADAKAAADYQAAVKQKEIAQNEAAQREKSLVAHADSLRLERDRVRNDNAALRADIASLSVQAARAVADAGVAVFGECSDRYSAVAIAADQCLSERQTLIDAWPK